MSGFPTQLPWRRFASLLRDLGYRPLKSHQGSVRQFFNPRAAQTWSHSTSLIRATHCTKQPCTTLYGSSSSAQRQKKQFGLFGLDHLLQVLGAGSHSPATRRSRGSSRGIGGVKSDDRSGGTCSLSIFFPEGVSDNYGVGLVVEFRTRP